MDLLAALRKHLAMDATVGKGKSAFGVLSVPDEYALKEMEKLYQQYKSLSPKALIEKITNGYTTYKGPTDKETLVKTVMTKEHEPDMLKKWKGKYGHGW